MLVFRQNANPFAADSPAATVNKRRPIFWIAQFVLHFSVGRRFLGGGNPNAPMSAGGANHIAPHLAVRSRNRRRLTGIINASNYFPHRNTFDYRFGFSSSDRRWKYFSINNSYFGKNSSTDVCIICSRTRSGKFPQASFIRSRIVAGSGLASSSRRV